MAMTAQNIIDAALRTLGVIASGESPSAEESADGLIALNNLIDSWTAQAVPIYQVTRETVAMDGSASYTLTTRPTKILAAQYQNGGVSVKFDLVSSDQWANPSEQNVIWFDGGFASSKIYPRPMPSAGNMILDELRPLTTFASLATAASLPHGYQRALVFNLALDLAGDYGAPISEALVGLANDAKVAIQGLNQNNVGVPIPVEADTNG